MEAKIIFFFNNKESRLKALENFTSNLDVPKSNPHGEDEA